MLNLLCWFVLAMLSWPANAGIQGMLGLNPPDKALAKPMGRIGDGVILEIYSAQSLPEIFVTTYMPGGGGHAMEVLNALSRGLPLPIDTIASWFPATARPTFFLGIFTDRQVMSSTGFGGEEVAIPHTKVVRIRDEVGADRVRKQTFLINLQVNIPPAEFQEVASNRMQLLFTHETLLSGASGSNIALVPVTQSCADGISK